MNDTDIALLTRWRGAGDAEAFSGLVTRHADMVYAVCRRITGSATEAEDVAQECFLRLAQCKDSIRSSVAGWLHGLAVWRSLDRLRAENRRRRLERVYAESSVAVEIVWNEVQPHIDEAIADLPVRMRDMVVRHFLEGETHAQIAESLGLSRSSVTRSINRGIEQVRKSLRRKGVSVEMPALVALVTANGAETAPATLKVTLGELAVSGIASAAPFSLGSLLRIDVGGMRLAAGKSLLVGLGALTLIGAAYLVKGAGGATRDHGAVEGSALAPVSTSTSDEPNSAFVSLTEPAAKPDVVIAPRPAASETKSAKPGPRTSSISGRVRDEFKANPIAGARVQITAQKDAHDFTPTLFTGETDANGDYTVAGIDFSGPAAICVSAPDYGDNYKEITLKPGDSLSGVDVEIYKGFQFVGQVLSYAGAPVAGAVVRPQRMRTSIMLTDKDGLFRFGDNYDDQAVTVEIVAKGHGASLFADVAFKPGEVMPLRLSPPASIRGRITWSDGAPAAGCSIETRPITTEEIEMAKKGLPTRGFALDFTGIVGKDGHYEIENLAPSLRYSAFFRLPDGKYRGYKGEIGPLARGSAYEFNTVLSIPTKVSGRIMVSGNGLVPTEACVRAVREGPDHAHAADYHANGGKYTLNIEEPGTYRIGADYDYVQRLDENLGLADLDPEMAKFEKRVEVKAGDDQQIDLEVPPPYAFSVRAVDVDGKPVPTVQIGLTWPSPSGDVYGTSTAAKADSEGRYTWHCKPGREVWIKASADGYIGTATEHVTIIAGVEAPERKLVLYRAASLKANPIVPEEIHCRGVRLQVTYPDGVVADMPTTTYGGGKYAVVNAVRASRMTVVAVEVDAEAPHRSQPVDCTVVAGEVYDLGDMTVE